MEEVLYALSLCFSSGVWLGIVEFGGAFVASSRSNKLVTLSGGRFGFWFHLFFMVG
jgi:hypothetical protein